MGERQNYARTIVARALLPCRQICVAARADAPESIAHPTMSAPQQIPHREQGGGQGSRAEPGTGTCRSRQLRAGPTRYRFAVRGGPQNENVAPSGALLEAARDRARPQPRSAFRSHHSCMRRRKEAGTGEGSCPIARQNSSIAPGTVCTMRFARCGGTAL